MSNRDEPGLHLVSHLPDSTDLPIGPTLRSFNSTSPAALQKCNETSETNEKIPITAYLAIIGRDGIS